MLPSLQRHGITALLAVMLLFPIGESHAQRKRDRAKHKSTFESERVLVDNGSTLYRIVVPSAPRDIDLEAADVLQQYLLQISNAALPSYAPTNTAVRLRSSWDRTTG